MATKPYTGPSARPAFPILGILGLIFVTMKLAGFGAVASWSWWWVLAPFWGPFAVVAGFLAIGALLFGVGKLIDVALRKWDKRKKARANGNK